jgi:hypothetical protein
MMMVGLAFLDLNIVAAGIVSNASMMLAKLSSTIIWKYSMKLLLRTLASLTWKSHRSVPDPGSELRTNIRTDGLRSALVSQAAAIARSEGT